MQNRDFCTDFGWERVSPLYGSSYGVNHPKEQQGKKESRITGRSLPFYTQMGAKQLERAMKGAESRSTLSILFLYHLST